MWETLWAGKIASRQIGNARHTRSWRETKGSTSVMEIGIAIFGRKEIGRGILICRRWLRDCGQAPTARDGGRMRLRLIVRRSLRTGNTYGECLGARFLVGVRLLLIGKNILGYAAEVVRKAGDALRCGDGMEGLNRRNVVQNKSRETLRPQGASLNFIPFIWT